MKIKATAILMVVMGSLCPALEAQVIKPLAFRSVSMQFDSNYQVSFDAYDPGYLTVGLQRWWEEGGGNIADISALIEANPGLPVRLLMRANNKDTLEEDFDVVLPLAVQLAENYGDRIKYYTFGLEMDFEGNVLPHDPDPKNPNIDVAVVNYVGRIEQFYDAIASVDPDAKMCLSFAQLASNRPVSFAIIQECEARIPGVIQAVDGVHHHEPWGGAEDIISRLDTARDVLNDPAFPSFNNLPMVVGENTTYTDGAYYGLAEQSEENQASYVAKTLILGASHPQVEFVTAGICIDRPYLTSPQFILNGLFFHPTKIYSDGHHSGPKLSAYTEQVMSYGLNDVESVTQEESGDGNVFLVRLHKVNGLDSHVVWLSEEGDFGSTTRSYDLNIGLSSGRVLASSVIPFNIPEAERAWPVASGDVFQPFPHEGVDVTGGSVSLTLENHRPLLVMTDIPAAPPVAASVDPVTGSSDANEPVSFTATYNDANGKTDLKYVHFAINDGSPDVDQSNAVYFRQKIGSNNYVYLRNDAGDDWLPRERAGTATFLENSRVRADMLEMAKITTLDSVNYAFKFGGLSFKDSFGGERKIWMKAYDGSTSGWREMGTWAVITGVPTSPEPVSITPSSGVSAAGDPSSFSGVYADANGKTDLKYMHFAISGVSPDIDQSEAVHIRHKRGSNNYVYLRNDAGTDWLEPERAGTATFLDNSRVHIDMLGMNKVTTPEGVNYAFDFGGLMFKDSFAGQRKIWMKAYDGTTTGWKEMGVWSVTTDVPTTTNLVSVSPESGSSSAGTPVSFTAVYEDLNGEDDLQYVLLAISAESPDIDDSNAVILRMKEPKHKVYLKRTDGSGHWLPMGDEVIGGEPVVVSHEFVDWDLTQVGVIKNGTVITVTWGGLSFSEDFVGDQRIWMRANEFGSGTTGWVEMGRWTVVP